MHFLIDFLSILMFVCLFVRIPIVQSKTMLRWLSLPIKQMEEYSDLDYRDILNTLFSSLKSAFPHGLRATQFINFISQPVI
jgi:hypothetical protein